VDTSNGSRTVPSSSAENAAATPYTLTSTASPGFVNGTRDRKSVQKFSYEPSYESRSVRAASAKSLM
jgi:hypothetical protein